MSLKIALRYCICTKKILYCIAEMFKLSIPINLVMFLFAYINF